MSISACMIIISLSIVLRHCLTKLSDWIFIRCHNVRLESYRMVVTTYIRALSWHDDVRACSLTDFVPYPLHKTRLMSSFSYWWIWNIYVLISYHLLSVDYVRIQLVHFCLFFLFLHNLSCPFSPCLHTWFDSSYFCIHTGLNLFFVWATLNHISNTNIFRHRFF